MTEREALKLAQKALSNRNAPPKTIYEALHAIKEALARQDVRDEIDRGAKTLREIYLAQPEQEPVAIADGTFNHNCPIGTPLYTTPPQRTWVGLTDEDKQTAFDETQEGGGFWEFADAIEAKLKEKNT